MKKMHKMFKILEIVWLTISIVGICSFIYSMVGGRRDQSVYFLAFTIIAGIMYAVRRNQRKKAEAIENKENPS